MTHNTPTPHFPRRDFLKAAGLLTVGFTLGRAEAAAPGLKLGPYGPPKEELDTWIAVDRSGVVTLYSGVSDLGSGNHTGLLQIVAEELDVAFGSTRFFGPDTDRTPDQFVSSGSRSIAVNGIPIRRAAAQARDALVNMAAKVLNAPAGQLRVEDGVVSVVGAPQRRVSYGDLIGDNRFNLKINEKIKTKPPSDYKIVGTAVPRIDFPEKITGSFEYVQNVRLPGMLHGRVVRPPAHGATALEVDEQSVAKIPGLVKVVRKGDLIGVVCEREEQAIKAAAALQIKWSRWAELPEMKDLHGLLREAPEFPSGYTAYGRKSPGGILANEGDADKALAGAAKTVTATYESPYHSHGSIGPSCCVADVRADGVTLWAATQTPYGLREAVAKFLGHADNNKVRLIFAQGAGCYGQNGADDVAIDAVVLSQAVGRPVRVQWSRADEHGWETYKSARTSDLTGGLDAEGKIVGWKTLSWTYSGYSRPEYHAPLQGGEPGSLVTARLAGWPDTGLEEGYNGSTLEAVPEYYDIHNMNVVIKYLGPASHRDGSIRIRTGSLRGVGAPDNLFAVESFMDELAAAANLDPVEFRRRHLTDERSLAVLNTVAERAGWKPRKAPRSVSDISSGRGVAMFIESNNRTRVASVFDVDVNRKTGAIKVKRVTVAIDVGLAVNPESVKSQVEGSVIQGISRLTEEITFDRSRITSLDWATYPILTFEDVPEQIDITIIQRPEFAASGAGEGATKNVWPGIANAIFDATGVRLRRLPLKPDTVRQALAQA